MGQDLRRKSKSWHGSLGTNKRSLQSQRKENDMGEQRGKVSLSGSQRDPLRGAKLEGDADPGKVITVSMYVRRNPDAGALPPINKYALGLPGRRRQFTERQIQVYHGASQ